MASAKISGRQPAGMKFSDWQTLAAAAMKTDTLDGLVSRTLDGIAIQPVYGPHHSDTAGLQPVRHQNGLAWQIMQRADMPDIGAANRQIHEDLMNGASGITLVLPGSLNAAGWGVAVGQYHDLTRLFDGIEADLVSVRLDGGLAGPLTASHLLDFYKQKNLDMTRVELSLCVDLLGEFARHGQCAGNREMSAVLAQLMDKATAVRFAGDVLCGDGRIYHNGGSSDAQEIGYALASLVDQTRMLEQTGRPVDDVWPRTSLLLTSDGDIFPAMAKLRAARILWQRLGEIMKVGTGVPKLHVETSARMMCRKDPHVNLLRTTAAILAAGNGGASSLTVLPFTHALGLAGGFARRMARNQQIILAEESAIGRVDDAAAGSGYVEDLSIRLAEKAWQIIQETEQLGGLYACLVSGHVKACIDMVRRDRLEQLACGQTDLLGVSIYPPPEEVPVDVLEMALTDSWQMVSAGGEVVCSPLVMRSLEDEYQTVAARKRDT